MKEVGVDPGRKGTKVFTLEQSFYFPSKLGSYRELNLEKEISEMDMIVEFNGRKYFVGEIAEEAYDVASNFLKSKVTLDTEILTLVALHKVVNNEEHIRLVTCHPVGNHKGTDKVKLKNMLLGRKQIKVNDIQKTFYIDSVSVTPECACSLFIIDDLPHIAHCIDIGSATVNYSTFINGNWADKLSGTIPYGFDNSNLPIETFARKVSMDFAKRIQMIRGNIYIIGGLTESITPYLIQFIPNHRVISVPDALFANARACYEIGVRLNEKEKSLQEK